MIAFLDTHAAVFLWEGRIEAFGPGARRVLSLEPLRISPIVRLELQYLREIGRIAVAPDEIIGGLELDCGVELARDLLDAVVARAMALVWTRDPFDRLLVAHAALHDAHFVSRDRTVRDHYALAVWD